MSDPRSPSSPGTILKPSGWPGAHPGESNPDIVVVGGGIAGVMAALAAKTSANRVLIIEPSNVLGGQGTAGGVAGFCGDTQNVNDEFRELVRRLSQHHYIRDFEPTQDRRSYDLEWCAFFLQEMVLERGIQVLLHARVVSAHATSGVLTGVDVSTVGGLVTLRPKFTIDASGACVIPVLTGWPVVHEGANKQLPMSLYFTLWDTGKPVEPYLPPSGTEWSSDEEIPMTTLHHFESGKVEVKMKVVGFDAADGFSFSYAELYARQQMVSLIYYLQTRGYRGIKLDRHILASVSRQIGVRETRRIVGEHVLTEHQVTHGAVFHDAVAVGTYHLDFHWPDTMQRRDTGITTMLEPYHIPLRAMVPKGARNVLVPGRAASGDQMAMSSFRVMATAAQMGFAAGKAAQACVAEGADLQHIDIGRLQATIDAGGQRLDLSHYGAYLRNSIVTHEHVPAAGVALKRCRATTLVHLANNRFLAAWFADPGEGADDAGIWMADRFEGMWSAPRLAMKVEAIAGPVLCRTREGNVRLYFRTGSPVSSWRTWSSDSGDGGRTWLPAVEIGGVDVIAPGPVVHKPLILEDGTWLAGNSVVTNDQWQIVVDRSSDGGCTWSHGPCLGVEENLETPTPPASSPPDGPLKSGSSSVARGVIQPALWTSGGGRIHVLARSTAGALYRSDSEDNGRTWRALYRTDIRNNNRVIDVVRLSDGALVLAHHPGADMRASLRLSVSFDNGATWPHSRELEKAGEYSDPTMIVTPRGIALVYTCGRQTIAFWHGSVEQILCADTTQRHAELLHSGVMP